MLCQNSIVFLSLIFFSSSCVTPQSSDPSVGRSQPIAQNPVTESVTASVTASTNEPGSEAVTEATIWQQNSLLRNYAQFKLAQTSALIAADGAIASNQQQPEQVQVGWQRAAYDQIAVAVASDDRREIQRGILGFQWAFDRQSPDGTFGRSQFPEVITFLGSYARALLLLQSAGYTEEADSLARYLPQVQKTLKHPEFLTVERRWEQHEAQDPVTNQLFWAAFCYHLLHLVQSNTHLEQQAQAWVQTGLERQRSDGSFPEKGGSDTHYQSWSLELLSLYSLYSSPADRTQFTTPLRRGFGWLSGKLMRDGTFDVSDNTRTGRDQERAPSGEFKQGRFGSPLPYIYWSYLGGGTEAEQTARRILEANNNR